MMLAAFSETPQKLAHQGLEMVKFGLDNTFIAQEHQHWLCGGLLPIKAKGPMIGGLQSSFFVDSVATHPLENSEDKFNNCVFFKICRDDGIDF